MEYLQTLLDSSSMPVLTAFILGLLTAVSPCPLATNIAAIGYLSKDVTDRRRIFANGLLYTLGRILSYTVLGIVLIAVIREGSSMFDIQKAIASLGEIFVGPLLILIGLFMLVGDRLNLQRFALAFCPASGVFYFGMLIQMSATVSAGYFLPVAFAVATALPVLLFAWLLAFSVNKIGSVYGKIQTFQAWLKVIVGILFVGIGIYYCCIMFF